MSLDIPGPQVLVGDAAGHWDHRVLLRRLRDAVWIALDGNGGVELIDLAPARIVALGRNQTFPVAAADTVDTFTDTLTDEELRDAHARAARTAALFGDAAGTATAGSSRLAADWRVCHTGSELFGEIVADDVVSNSSTGVDKGTMGLALIDGLWWPVERVQNNDYQLWASHLRSGPGRDPRIAGDRRDATGRRFVSLHDCLGMLRTVDRSKDKDYPHRGPSAAVEVLQGVRASGRELVPYDEMWASQSGVSPGSAIRLLHKTIFHALALFQQWDQLDLPATAGGEYLCRRAVQVQRAVRASPKAPSFAGLERMCEHSLDEGGGLAMQEFTQHYATLAESEAKIMKQQRLLKAEMAASTQMHGAAPKDTDDEDDVTKLPRRRPKRKARPKPAGGGQG